MSCGTAEPVATSEDKLPSAGMNCGTAEPESLLDGTFDEIANRRAFLQALCEWRNGCGAPAGGLEGQEEHEQREGEEEQEQSEEEEESISFPSHEHQDEEEDTAEEATARAARAAKERVDEALKSFAEMGELVDLSKEGRADEQSRYLFEYTRLKYFFHQKGTSMVCTRKLAK
jgi:hypothetical protein